MELNGGSGPASVLVESTESCDTSNLRDFLAAGITAASGFNYLPAASGNTAVEETLRSGLPCSTNCGAATRSNRLVHGHDPEDEVGLGEPVARHLPQFEKIQILDALDAQLETNSPPGNFLLDRSQEQPLRRDADAVPAVRR